MDTYIVGVDGSEIAARAARRAAELAGATGAHLHVVCAHPAPADTVFRVGADTFEFSEETRAASVAEAAASEVRSLCAYVTSAATEGNAADVLLAEADAAGASLIVVGSHGLSGVSGLLGSVTAAVLHHAACDVLVVRATR